MNEYLFISLYTSLIDIIFNNQLLDSQARFASLRRNYAPANRRFAFDGQP